MAAIFLLLYLSGVVVIEVTNYDRRPTGSVDQIEQLRERRDEVGVMARAFDAARVGRDHAQILETHLRDMVDDHGRGEEVVDGHVEEALDL